MPVCFMIMPYGRKPTQAEPGQGPAEIDFNALWDRGYVPVIKELGYEPVRADQDTGALIIGQMLERLYFADLVLADMTIPNGNVYYEVGIRHAAQKTGCVLLAADWSKQLFDVMQMRTVRYPLPEGNVTDKTASALHAKIKGGIVALRDGLSPMHQSIPGYPANVDPHKCNDDKGPAYGACRVPNQSAPSPCRGAASAHATRTSVGRERGSAASDLPDCARIAALTA